MKWRTVLFVLIAGLAAASAPAQTQPMDTTAQPLTLSGTVVSQSGSQLVIDTDSGRKTFVVDVNSASLPVGITVGSRVSVQYHDMSGQMHLAKASILETSTTPTNVTPLDQTPPVEPEPALPRVSTPVEPTVTGSAQGTAPATTPEPAMTDTTTAERTLPRTASPVPLAGLVGALALAGGLALRLRR